MVLGFRIVVIHDFGEYMIIGYLHPWGNCKTAMGEKDDGGYYISTLSQKRLLVGHILRLRLHP